MVPSCTLEKLKSWERMTKGHLARHCYLALHSVQLGKEVLPSVYLFILIVCVWYFACIYACALEA